MFVTFGKANNIEILIIPWQHKHAIQARDLVVVFSIWITVVSHIEFTRANWATASLLGKLSSSLPVLVAFTFARKWLLLRGAVARPFYSIEQGKTIHSCKEANFWMSDTCFRIFYEIKTRHFEYNKMLMLCKYTYQCFIAIYEKYLDNKGIIGLFENKHLYVFYVKPMFLQTEKHILFFFRLQINKGNISLYAIVRKWKKKHNKNIVVLQF
jgi:hypothetical protein